MSDPRISASLNEYRKWLDKNTKVNDPLSKDGLRNLVIQLLLGKNYRIFTEQNVKNELILTYLWLKDISTIAKEDKMASSSWIESLQDLLKKEKSSNEIKHCMQWILGLTDKTAKNLDLDIKRDYKSILMATIEHINKMLESIGRKNDLDDIWLMLMAGSATLNIRGSHKSSSGKTIEKVFISSMLSMLGLEKDVD